MSTILTQTNSQTQVFSTTAGVIVLAAAATWP